jgi:hydrogenase/urease accessory protein HupE
MKSSTLTFAGMLLVMCLPECAHGHPGPHPQTSLYDALMHFLSEPDHLAFLLAVGVLLVVLGVRSYRRRTR